MEKKLGKIECGRKTRKHEMISTTRHPCGGINLRNINILMRRYSCGGSSKDISKRNVCLIIDMRRI
jgi:hypothetical protein